MESRARRPILNACTRPAGILLFIAALQLAFSLTVSAHEAGNLTDMAVNRTNDAVADAVLEVQGVLTELLRGSRGDAAWPDPDLLRLRDELKHFEEDTAMSLEYLTDQGINLRDPEALERNPLAGRAVAANRAIASGTALLEHVISLSDRETFVKEIYGRELAYYMYDLLGAYRDKLLLYALLMERESG